MNKFDPFSTKPKRVIKKKSKKRRQTYLTPDELAILIAASYEPGDELKF